ncbi:hypothetical protein ACH5RR_018217 [Cinchona calisaya]|uniref:Transposase n=1 Tax=Cinchona calisaya TaxID=153742 RepID=A0ABD2ZQW2_9GENT
MKKGRKVLICGFCKNQFASGGIHCLKLHLAGERDGVAPCTKVALEVRHANLGSWKEYAQKPKEKIGDFGEENPYGCSVNDFDGDDIQEIHPPQPKGVSINMVGASASKGKRKATIGINAYFKDGCDTSQPTIKACLQSKEKWHNTDMVIALWFYDACILINAVNSPFYQRAIDHIASMGHGYKGTYYHALRVLLLRDAKKEVQLVIDSLHSNGTEFGCTIMGDRWKDSRQRIMGHLIRLLHVCDANENPSMGYVYNGMQRAIEEFWVVEEVPVGELDYKELEAELEELPVDDDVECSNFQQVEDVDLESIQRRGIDLIDEDDEWPN